MYRVLQFVFVLLSLVSMQSIYSKLVSVDMDSIFFVISAGVLFLLIILKTKNIRYDKKLLTIIIYINISMGVMLFYRVVISDLPFNFIPVIIITFLFSIFLSMSILYFSNEKNILLFLKDFVNIVFILSLLSLIFFILGQNFDILPKSEPIQIKWGGTYHVGNWLYLHFNPQGTSYKYLINGRNTGIYTEAPQYAFILCMALGVDYLLLKRKFNLKNIIIAMTVFTTASTSGVIVMIVLLLFKFLITEVNTQNQKNLKYLIGTIFFSLSLYFILNIYIEKKDFGNSYAIRANNSSVAWNNFLNYPLFGVGFKSDALGLNAGNTSTITQIMQEGGILFFIVYFFGTVYVMLNSIRERQFQLFYFIGIYLLLLYPTVMTYTQLSVLLVGVMYVLSTKNPKDVFEGELN